MSVHDFGTVVLRENCGALEVDLPKGDERTKQVIRSFKATWMPNAFRWSVDPTRTRTTIAAVVEAVRKSLVEGAPEAWNKALPTLRTATVTTNRFSLVVAEGGVRFRLAPGHRHEYLMRDLKDKLAFEDRQTWKVPAAHCLDKRIRQVLADILKDDREALSKMVDYMQGYALVGTLDLLADEGARVGLSPGSTVFANKSFVRKADASVPKEDVPEYPMLVREATPGGEGTAARLAFVTGEAAWTALRRRHGVPESERAPAMDARHVSGKWVRKRVA